MIHIPQLSFHKFFIFLCFPSKNISCFRFLLSLISLTKTTMNTKNRKMAIIVTGTIIAAANAVATVSAQSNSTTPSEDFLLLRFQHSAFCPSYLKKKKMKRIRSSLMRLIRSFSMTMSDFLVKI